MQLTQDIHMMSFFLKGRQHVNSVIYIPLQEPLILKKTWNCWESMTATLIQYSYPGLSILV